MSLIGKTKTIPAATIEVVKTGLTASLAAMGFEVAANESLTYLWSGAGVTFVDPTLPATQMSVAAAGAYQVSLTVTNSLGYSETVYETLNLSRNLHVFPNLRDERNFTKLQDAFDWITNNDLVNGNLYAIYVHAPTLDTATVNVPAGVSTKVFFVGLGSLSVGVNLGTAGTHTFVGHPYPTSAQITSASGPAILGNGASFQAVNMRIRTSDVNSDVIRLTNGNFRYERGDISYVGTKSAGVYGINKSGGVTVILDCIVQAACLFSQVNFSIQSINLDVFAQPADTVGVWFDRCVSAIRQLNIRTGTGAVGFTAIKITTGTQSFEIQGATAWINRSPAAGSYTALMDVESAGAGLFYISELIGRNIGTSGERHGLITRAGLNANQDFYVNSTFEAVNLTIVHAAAGYPIVDQARTVQVHNSILRGGAPSPLLTFAPSTVYGTNFLV